MKNPHVNVNLSFDEAYALWREGKNPRTINISDVLLAMAARKKIAHAMRGKG
jgi:hypothetical protein